jgi:hypothetical protein
VTREANTTGVALVFVTWIGRVSDIPTNRDPKSSDAGANVSAEGAPATSSDTNSSEVAESETISSDAIWTPAVCGTALTVIVQLAPTTTVPHVVCKPKSDVAKIEAMWVVTVPEFVNVIDCGAEMLPTVVSGKLSELCDTANVASGAAFAGLATAIGAPSPERLIVSGPDAASLSMTNESASGLAAGEVVSIATWFDGA